MNNDISNNFTIQNLDDLNILVVEDSVSARSSIVSSLQQLGGTIFEEDDGTPAFERIKQNPDQIDLLVSDLHMKEMNGDKLCWKIRNELMMKDLPIIILSADRNKKTTVALFKAGATDYLYKPFIQEELVARIHVHLKQQKMKKMLKENIKELQTLNKMKDEFLAVCSHDLRSPLTGILGFADLLMDDIENKDHLDMLGHIISSGGDLLLLINDILELGQAEVLQNQMEMKLLEVGGILSTCITNFKQTASAKSIRLVLSDNAGKTQIMGNKVALSRIFNNLVSNAVKFTPIGGKIVVKTASFAPHTLCISVVDNGIGIPEDKIPDLFNRYSQISRVGTGGEKSTGLGLSITHELVNAHNGRIEVKSCEKKGSVFKVFFPLWRDPDGYSHA